MGNKELDKYLNDLLGNYKPKDLQPDWDQFSAQLDPHQVQPSADDSAFDNTLKESFYTYKTPEQVEGWQRVQASLDAQDKQFDEDVRKRIENFEPHYDPRTWPLFLQRLADSRFLGAKLIALKAIEVAAVILILLTVVNMGRMGKLPFDTPLYNEPSQNSNNQNGQNSFADQSGLQSSKAVLNDQKDNSGSGLLSPSFRTDQKSLSQSHQVLKSNTWISAGYAAINTIGSGIGNDVNRERSLNDAPFNPVIYPETSQKITQTETGNSLGDMLSLTMEGNPTKGLENTNAGSSEENLLASNDRNPMDITSGFLFSLISPVVYSSQISFRKPSLIKQHHPGHAEFGILAQVDYNRLRMPEDRLYSTGRQIVFPQQGLPSYGFGGGFTLASAHPRYALETGLIYNSKTFEPGRKLAIGTAFDNGLIEFEAMRLQLVTLPVQFRYKLSKSGPLKFYTLAGFGLNLIVQSNIDVVINYHFASLSAGENPNSNPDLANTIKETKRISSQIRDGAPFSTKSFLSATAGLGIEYSINTYKTFFLQAALQYQIPYLEFSNNNGKYIRSISVQAGVRTPLGN